MIARHDYPPDQFWTMQSTQPSEPKTVPTNAYPSSQALLASKFAPDIRKNKELPESQRKPVSQLLPHSSQWSTHGDQASPDLAPAFSSINCAVDRVEDKGRIERVLNSSSATILRVGGLLKEVALA